ncbi:MAG: type II and III secretion system protein family protein [Blastocatellia bacterium]
MNIQLRRFHPVLRCASLLVLIIALGVGVTAQEKATIQASFANNSQPVKIDVLVGQSRVIEFDQDVDRVASSDPKVVETVPISLRQVLFNGLQFGQVNLVAWSKPRVKGEASRMLVFDIYVQVNLSLIDNQIKILFPKENIQLSQANNSVVLSGSVTKPELSEQAQKIIEAAGLKVTNLLKSPVMDALQVQLQIRVAEVNRQILREVSAAYGVPNNTIPAYISPAGPGEINSSISPNLRDPNLPGLNTILSSVPGINLLLGNPNDKAGVIGFIRALHQRGAIRDLAEPNLIAMNGQKASFLAGGEFPIPIIQSLNSGQTSVTIYFKEFGIRLNFTPKIIDENHIQLEMEPEVSTPDYTYGIVLQGYAIPGLVTRKAKTTLELRDGQSFALAGLIDNREQVSLSKIPLLGDIPILGELFKSRRFQRNETELLFLATVKMVEPLNPDQIPRLPGVSELKPVTANPAGATPSGSIEGQSGHSIPRKAGEQPPEGANKTKSEQPATNKVDRSSTANLTSGAPGPVGPTGVDAPTQKAENAPPKPEAPKPETKEQKPSPPGNDKP